MTLPSGLPEHVGDEEDIARFLTSSGQYNASGVKPAAFLPNPHNGETSVFRHGAQPLESFQAIGQRELGARSPQGAAIVKASVVREVDLELRAGEPPPLHADIIGWPGQIHDPELGKAERKERAALIAQRAGEHFGSEANGHGGVTPNRAVSPPEWECHPGNLLKCHFLSTGAESPLPWSNMV